MSRKPARTAPPGGDPSGASAPSDGRTPAWFAALAFLLIASFLLRWGYVSRTEMVGPVRADAREYVAIAQNLAVHGVWSMESFAAGERPRSSPSNRPPGYPIILSLVLRAASAIHGPRWLPASWKASLGVPGARSLPPEVEGFFALTLLLQCLLGAGTVVLAVLLGRIWLSAPLCLLLGVLVAFSPHLISFANYLLTETLFTFLFTLAVYLIALAFRTEDALPWLWAGLAMGAAVLVRPTVVLLPLGIAAMAAWRFKGERRRALGAAGLFLAGSFLLFGSWTAWSAVSLDGPANPRSLTRIAFYQGAYPGLVYRDPSLRGMVYRDDPSFFPTIEGGWGPTLAAAAGKFSEEPARMASWYLFGKPLILWGWGMLHQSADIPGGDINEYPARVTWYETNRLMAASKSAMKAAHWPLVALMHLGAVLFAFGTLVGKGSERWAMGMLLVCLAYFWAVHVALTPAARYALPLRPVVFVVALLAAERAVTFVRRTWPRSRSPLGTPASS